MARVSIVFEDTDEGVSMDLFCDPDFPASPSECTHAQAAGLVVFQQLAAGAEIESEGEDEIEEV